MKSFLITLLLATSLGLCSTVAAIAVEAADESKLAGIIENAKILGKGYRVRVTFSGPEVSVSTFRAAESANTDNDCKITAALIAKELMINHDFGFRKARIYFHEPTMVGLFREVAVSYAELQALESGAVKQSDFMESISVNKMPEKSGIAGGASSSANLTSSGSAGTSASSGAGSSSSSSAAPAGSNAASSGSGAPRSSGSGEAGGSSSSGAPGSSDSSAGGTSRTTGSETDSTMTATTATSIAGAAASAPAAGGVALPSTSNAPAQKKPEAVKLYTSKKGSRFAIPEGWVVEDNYPHDPSLLFKLFSPATGERNIEFSFDGRSGKTPAQCALEQRQKFNYSGVKIERYEQVKFGAGKYPGALIVLTYPNWDDEGKRYYEMHLYFGQRGGIYDMWGWCVFSKFKHVEPAFQKIMATMEFSPAKGASASKSATQANSTSAAKKGTAAAKTSPPKKK